MLTQEETDFLCRVGPGTPMGDLMRQYWLPVTYSWELEPNGQPQRVRVLGEDLLAWRDTNGTPAFTEQRCVHRGASLYFGRNEECGLRCAYHGWKYDADGNCIDMPNEPPESNFKSKVRLTAYRGADFGGVTWIYMGEQQKDPPGVPQFEWGLVSEDNRRHYRKAVYECNWMQALEGEMDTTHVYFLHSRLSSDLPSKYGTWLPERSAVFHIENAAFGLTYGGERKRDDGNSYWRTSHFLFPMYGMFPATESRVPLSIYVPIDDEHTLHFGLEWHPSEPIPGSRWPMGNLPDEPGALSDGMGPMKPEQKGKFFANWWPEVCPETDFFMDLDAKKSKSVTGMPGVRIQDEAIVWSMGPIMDRTREHLGAADATIIRVRRRLMDAARALREDGTPPPGSEQPELYKVRSCQAVLPPDSNWLEALGDWHYARSTGYPDTLVRGSVDR